MLFKVLLCLGITSRLFSLENSVEKRPEIREMTVSVIIPCDATHFQELSILLEHLRDQTIVPNEVVISLSRVESLEENAIISLENQEEPFSLKILRHYGTVSAGENRNLAAKHSSGDILICQDADDLPHPQRVEIAKYMFQTYHIDHLIHGLISPYKTFIPYEIDKIPVHRFVNIIDRNRYCADNNFYIHNGNICYTRKVAENLSWDSGKTGEDTRFNERIYASSYRSILIHANLIMYRVHLSTNVPGFKWPEDIDF